MSISIITPPQPATTAQQQLCGPSADSDFWNARAVQNGFLGLTKVEGTRLFLRLFGIAAAGTGTALTTLAVMGSITTPVGLLAVPCFLSAVGAIWYSTQFNDYENPEELARFQRDAAQMSLDQVGQAHGWTNTLQWGILTPDLFQQKYRQQLQGKDLAAIINYYEKISSLIAQTPHPRHQYQTPPPRESRGQWHRETAAKTFEEIIQIYPLDKLEKYSILEVGELNRLKELKRDFDVVKRQYDSQVAVVERDYQNNTSTFKQNYDTACAQADQMYNNNFAVRDLQGFELRYIRERQGIQNRLIQRKSEAKARFDLSVAHFTNQGQIPYDRLQPAQKVIYDQKRQELQLAESQAETEARVQIAGIDAHCVSERVRLNAEEVRVRGERVRMINVAKGHFDAAIATHRSQKEERLRPIESAFRNTVNDINGRYRAYLRTLGIAH